MHICTGIFSDPHGAATALSGVVRVRGASAFSLEATT